MGTENSIISLKRARPYRLKDNANCHGYTTQKNISRKFYEFFLASENKVPLKIKESFHYKNSTLKKLSANPWQEKCKERNPTKSFAKAILSSYQRMHLYDKDFMVERKIFFFFLYYFEIVTFIKANKRLHYSIRADKKR